MKRILIALFTIFACVKTFAEPNGGFIPSIPPIYAHPDVVEYAIKKYVVAPYDPNKVTAAYEQYMNQNDGTITLENLQQKVCPAGGMDYAQCKEFTNALMIPYYDVCDSGKGKSGGNEHCEKNFFYYAAPKNLSFGNGTYVRTKEAIGLAQEYALVKDKQKVVCVSTKGNSKKTDTIWCTSIDKKHFYEFKFNNIKETKDDYIKQSVLRAVCKMHNTTYTVGGVGAATIGDAPGLSYPDSCETENKVICANINKSLERGRFSYKATIGTSDVPPIGKHSTCVVEKVVNDISNLRSAYGIDPTVFKNVQAVAGEDIDNKIKQYVKQELQKQKITFDEKAFYCATSTNVLNGGEVLTCYVNNKPIDFLFKDLSEWIGVNKRGGAQAMDCIVSGGTFDGKRCINLNQKQCEMLRSANLKTCPKCNMAKWDAKNNVCTLPSSAAATNFQKDIKLVGMAAGAVASVAITIATAGTAGLTIGGYVILGVETTGAGLELWSQSKINKLSDEFFLKSNNCHSENCAGQLIETYLTDLAAIDRDLTADEADAVDKEMTRLVELILTNSNWWIDKLRNEDGTSFLEKADNGHWTAAQVWRAIGIGMQFAGVASSITKWILNKTGYLTRTLERTSKILEKNAEVAKKNFVTWNDFSSEWGKLWQEYAPQNQTLDQFKAMANGDINQMKEMVKNWTPRSERILLINQTEKQIQNLNVELNYDMNTLNKLMDKYNIDALPDNSTELQNLFKKHPDLESAYTDFKNTEKEIQNLELLRDDYRMTAYSTYDPEFNRVVTPYRQNLDDLDQDFEQKYTEAFALYKKVHKNATEEDFEKSLSYVNIYGPYIRKLRQISNDFQWQIAEEIPLQNIDNVAQSRSRTFLHITKDPKIDAYLSKWDELSDQERLDVTQKIMNQFSEETGTPVANMNLTSNRKIGGYYDPDSKQIYLNPKAQLQRTTDDMLEIISHEGGHLIDYQAPNEGALGEQFAHYATKMYSNKFDDGYRVALTEQSSYKIGETVGGTGTYVGEPKDIDTSLGIITGAPSAIAISTGVKKTKQEQHKKETIFEKYNKVKKDEK